ncbi:hypothetical protein KCP76_06215 [Salmonella enterica subsp. enterica serovar Weltevreden]|nr:hypothetical protein KCP76_06215 [Salmonella enterica subsp. enterica serovar Weltevreden]
MVHLKTGRNTWAALLTVKLGDHYWVRANAVPMIREGRVTGYISSVPAPRMMRLPPSAAHIRR